MQAAFEMHPGSALVLARGGWSAADGEISGLENCAVIPDKKNWEVGGANFYGISSLNEYYASFSVPSELSNLNFVYSQLAYSSVYSENIYSAGFSRKLTKKLSAGLRLNSYVEKAQHFEEGMATSRTSSDYAVGFLEKEKYFNAGISVLSIGSHETVFKKIPDDSAPSVRYGLVLKPVKGSKIGVDYVSGEPLCAGMELGVASALKTAIGIRKNVFTAGFSLRLPVLWLNFSLMTNNELGNAYFISVSRN